MSKGINDPQFDNAKALLSEDGVVLSITLLKKRLGIGDARAKAILEALQPFIIHTPADDDFLDPESPSQESSVEPSGSGLGQSVSSPDGVQVVTPSELPTQESPVGQEASTELPTEPSANGRARSGAVKGTLLGYDPTTGAEVYAE